MREARRKGVRSLDNCAPHSLALHARRRGSSCHTSKGTSCARARLATRATFWPGPRRRRTLKMARGTAAPYGARGWLPPRKSVGHGTHAAHAGHSHLKLPPMAPLAAQQEMSRTAPSTQSGPPPTGFAATGRTTNHTYLLAHRPAPRGGPSCCSRRDRRKASML